MRLHAFLACIISSLAAAQQVEAAPELAPARLTVRATAAEAVITIDGEVRGLAPRTETLEPGVHTIVAEVRGAPPVTRTVSLESGEQRTLRFDFVYPERPRAFPAIGTLMVASGGVLLGGGLLLRLRAEAAAAQVSGFFRRGGGWDAGAQQLENDGIAAETWSWVLVSIGAATIASGLIVGALELFGAPKTRPRLVLVPTPGGAMVGGGFAW